MSYISWFVEIMKYDLNVVFKFWLEGKDFIDERNKWVEENKTIYEIV